MTPDVSAFDSSVGAHATWVVSVAVEPFRRQETKRRRRQRLQRVLLRQMSHSYTDTDKQAVHSHRTRSWHVERIFDCF